ncbi:MAG: hypothetical protein JST04_18260 [Bdellovibrionales bacterium]|nr:hypothetical protein [Bdellovibrionales bacterium]
MKKSLVFAFIVTISSIAISGVRAEDVTDSRNSVTAPTPTEARIQLVTMAETGSTAASIDEVRKLVQSYRVDRTNGFMPLRLAPYPRFLINAQLGEIYPALYQSALDDFLNHIPLETLFDGVLDMVVKGNITDPEMKKQLSSLDKRMAGRAIKGKGPDCALDESDAIDAPSKIALIQLKIDVINSVSSCTYRKRLFNAAKEALLKARTQKSTKEAVKKAALEFDPALGEGKFQNEFRKGFLAKIDETIAGFPKLVQTKFGAGSATHLIWSDLGSVVEGDAAVAVGGGRREIRLKSFAQGLLADLFAANVLIKSKDPKDLSLAAGLFYAVVNRWLLLTGGIEADWDAQRAEMPIAVMNKGMTPPKFKEVAFGGWGADTDGFSVFMSPWDWGGYQPSDAKKPSPLRIFPTRFSVDANGVGGMLSAADAYQTNDDLAYLLLAVSEFLKVTQPGTALSKFFGGKDQIGDLMDPKKPMLFPTDGRMIAVGVLAAVAQNLLHPTIGHIASKRDGIPLYFRDHGSFGALQDTDIDTRGVCSLLVAASKLTRTLKTDPIMKSEPSLKQILPQISQLVQVSALIVGKEQGFDGAVAAKLNSADKSTTLGAQIAAIRVFLAAVNGSATPDKATFAMARLVAALDYLFKNQLNDPSKLDLEARLNLAAVWNQSQAALRTARPDLPWAEWEKVVRKL